jgi:hypothetical protein
MDYRFPKPQPLPFRKNKPMQAVEMHGPSLLKCQGHISLRSEVGHIDGSFGTCSNK